MAPQPPQSCPVCGSPDKACGGTHASNEHAPVDVPSTSSRPTPPTVLASAVINGIRTTILTTEAEAAARGWEVTGRRDGQALHEARPAVSAGNMKVSAPDPIGPPNNEAVPPPTPELPADLETLTVAELRALAAERDVAGRSKLNRAQLIKALRRS